MKKELEKKLHDKYPNLFIEKNLPETQTCMCWGCAHGDGWFDILNDLCGQITLVSKDIRFTQIKEKFGTLTVYFDTPNQGDYSTISSLVQVACERSASTCEVCGKPGTLNLGGWWKTLCEECKKRNGYPDDPKSSTRTDKWVDETKEEKDQNG